MGIVDTKILYKFGEIGEVVVEHINFGRPVDDEKIFVLVFLSVLEMAKERDWDISVSIGKIFSSISRLHPCTPDWFGVVVPCLTFYNSKPLVCGGFVNTGAAKGGHVAFPKGKFAHACRREG
jgi:hypothetical protein